MAAPKKTVGTKATKSGLPTAKPGSKPGASIKPAVKKSSGEFGEGNYRASQRFREQQETFVRKNKARIPALGKEAETALEGPEGKELRAAAAKAAGHAAKKS